MSIHEVPGPLPTSPLKKGAHTLSRVLMGKMWSHEAEIMRPAERRERRARAGPRAESAATLPVLRTRVRVSCSKKPESGYSCDCDLFPGLRHFLWILPIHLPSPEKTRTQALRCSLQSETVQPTHNTSETTVENPEFTYSCV